MKAQVGPGWLRWLAVALAFALLSSVAWAEPPQDKGEDKKPQKKAVTARASKDPIKVTRHPSTLQSTENYIIGPEDVLAINVWKEPEVSRNVPVRPDGRISLPLVGDIRVSGLTPLQLEERIIERLSNYISDPEVAVIVQAVNSRKFNLVGEIARPGTYNLTKRMTVLDAIALAGGPRDFAKVRKIYVLRLLENGEGLRIPFNYREVVKGKNLTQNVELEPGDTIVVP